MNIEQITKMMEEAESQGEIKKALELAKSIIAMQTENQSSKTNKNSGGSFNNSFGTGYAFWNNDW